jgi:YbgC/YbaW family acyl-CoA thioester hydrolase
MSSPFLVHRRVLFGDCDPAGIIYTPRVAHFVVEAGLEFFRDRLGNGPERKMLALGVAPPARALSIEFLRPFTWDDELEIEVRAQEIRTHAIVLRFTGRVSGQTAFTAELTQVCISTESKRPTPVPDVIRQALLGTSDS